VSKTFTCTVVVDMAAFERAIAQAHAEIDRLERRAAGLGLSNDLPLVLGAAAALASNTSRRFSRRSLLGLNWRSA